MQSSWLEAFRVCAIDFDNRQRLAVVMCLYSGRLEDDCTARYIALYLPTAGLARQLIDQFSVPRPPRHKVWHAVCV